MVVSRTRPVIMQFEQQVTKLQYKLTNSTACCSRVQNEDTITIPIPRKTALLMWKTLNFQQSESRDYLFECCNMAKWGQLNHSRFRSIYLLQIFKHTTCKYKWLRNNNKTICSKSFATLLTVHN